MGKLREAIDKLSRGVDNLAQCVEDLRFAIREWGMEEPSGPDSDVLPEPPPTSPELPSNRPPRRDTVPIGEPPDGRP